MTTEQKERTLKSLTTTHTEEELQNAFKLEWAAAPEAMKESWICGFYFWLKGRQCEVRDSDALAAVGREEKR